MKGMPKYNLGDIVKFKIQNEIKEGKIYIIDKYGTFDDNSDVSYDVLVENENCLYKHILEKYIENGN